MKKYGSLKKALKATFPGIEFPGKGIFKLHPLLNSDSKQGVERKVYRRRRSKKEREAEQEKVCIRKRNIVFFFWF